MPQNLPFRVGSRYYREWPDITVPGITGNVLLAAKPVIPKKRKKRPEGCFIKIVYIKMSLKGETKKSVSRRED